MGVGDRGWLRGRDDHELLGGSRQGRGRRYVNLLATMVLGGLWHGAGWNFVMWGALHGSYLAIHHGVSDLTPSLARRLRRLRLLNWALTFVAVVLAWVFFRATSWGGATSMLQAMLRPDLVPAGSPGEWLWIAAAGALAVAGCSALQIANGVEIALARRPEHLPPLQVCLQVNISGESSKSGVAPDETLALAEAVCRLPRLRLRGLMAIPEPAGSFDAQRAPHRALARLLFDLNVAGHALDTLSMGMSDDLEAAIAEGATIVRVGSAIFGERPRAVASQH